MLVGDGVDWLGARTLDLFAFSLSLSLPLCFSHSLAYTKRTLCSIRYNKHSYAYNGRHLLYIHHYIDGINIRIQYIQTIIINYTNRKEKKRQRFINDCQSSIDSKLCLNNLTYILFCFHFSIQ